MSIQTIDFKNTEADLAALGRVCKELEDKGLPPNEAAAHVLASMANQAIANGMDSREVIDALHQVITRDEGKKPQAEPKRQVRVLTQQQADELKQHIKFLQSFQLYWDMVLCAEVQRLSHAVLKELKDLGLYRHELKKYANKLEEETRRMQMYMNGNDRVMVMRWCSRMDKRNVYVGEFYDDGGSITSKFLLAYQQQFSVLWDVIRLDCRNIAGKLATKHQTLVAGLLELDALTNTGVDLFETFFRRIKALMAGKGSYSVSRSTHHESLRCATHNLLRKVVKGNVEPPEKESEYARKHLADMQMKMMEDGSQDLFQGCFDSLSVDFVHYVMAWMRIDMEFGSLKTGAIRMVYYRLGTRHRVEKFFKELRRIPMPEGNVDVFDVAEIISCDEGKHTEMDRFKRMCEKDEHFELPESEDKQESRMLRVLARRNSYMLPDDILRVMIMKHSTKTEVMRRLSNAGFELTPTLRRVRRMKIAELKQL